MEIGYGIEGTLFSPGSKGTIQSECEKTAEEMMKDRIPVFRRGYITPGALWSSVGCPNFALKKVTLQSET